jgi:hypothetical protein
MTVSAGTVSVVPDIVLSETGRWDELLACREAWWAAPAGPNSVMRNGFGPLGHSRKAWVG